jgi:hypothetical protein
VRFDCAGAKLNLALLHFSFAYSYPNIMYLIDHLQFLVLDWMFCIACSRLRESGCGADLVLAGGIVSCIQELHRLHDVALLSSVSPRESRDVFTVVIDSAQRIAESTAKLRT